MRGESDFYRTVKHSFTEKVTFEQMLNNVRVNRGLSVGRQATHSNSELPNRE